MPPWRRGSGRSLLTEGGWAWPTAPSPPAWVETAVFAGRALAGRLSTALAADGLACTRVRVEADTDHGERLARCWRLGADSLGPSVLAERIRGQLEAWVSAGEGPGGAG